MLEEIRILLCLITLGLSTYFDLKAREVEDKVWVPFAVIGATMLLYEVYVEQSFETILLFATSLTIAGILGFGIYRSGLFGGADAKALVTVTLLLPLYQPPVGIHPITPLILLGNTVFTSLFLPVSFAAWNIYRIFKKEPIFQGFEKEPSWRKLVALFLGLRVKSEKGERFLLRLEKSVEGKRLFDFSLSKSTEEFAQGEDIWVTPGIPLLLFMLTGFIIFILGGDIATALLLRIYGILP